MNVFAKFYSNSSNLHTLLICSKLTYSVQNEVRVLAWEGFKQHTPPLGIITPLVITSRDNEPQDPMASTTMEENFAAKESHSHAFIF